MYAPPALALPVHAAFRLAKDVGALIARFRSSIPRPPMPLFTLRYAPRDAQRKTRGRVDRYSFLVRLFHPLLQTGLSRRTGYLLPHEPARYRLAGRRIQQGNFLGARVQITSHN